MIRTILTKEEAYGKEDIRAGLLVDIAVVAVFPYCDYCDLFLYRIAAIGIFNLKARSRKAIGFVNSIPILNGDIITGISLFLLFVSLGITQGYTTVVLAHITFCTPYVVLSVLPRLKQMNPNIYEAALDLGATPMQALRKVIIPEIRPGMIGGPPIFMPMPAKEV